MILLKCVCLPVVVCELQVAILTQSSRDIYQTVRIDCHSFLSRVCIMVRPRKCFTGEKPPKTIAKTESPRECSVEWTSDVGICGNGWLPPTRRNGDTWTVTIAITVDSQRPVGTATTWTATIAVMAATDWIKTSKNSKSKRLEWDFVPSRLETNWLIMIMINIIILYFKHFTHTGDFARTCDLFLEVLCYSC